MELIVINENKLNKGYINEYNKAYIGDKLLYWNADKYNEGGGEESLCYTYDLNKSDIILFNESNTEYVILIKTGMGDSFEYFSPFYNHKRYSFTVIDSNNNNPKDTHLNNSSYYYEIPELKLTIYNHEKMFIPLKEYLNDYTVKELNDYMLSVLDVVLLITMTNEHNQTIILKTDVDTLYRLGLVTAVDSLLTEIELSPIEFRGITNLSNMEDVNQVLKFTNSKLQLCNMFLSGGIHCVEVF